MRKSRAITLGEWDHIAVIQRAHREQNTTPSMLAGQYGRSLNTIKKWLEVQIPAEAICNLSTNDRGKLLAAITLFGRHKTAEALGWPVQRLTDLHAWYYRYRTSRTITWHGETERARHAAMIAGEAKVAEYLANFSGRSKMSFEPERPPRPLYTIMSPMPIPRASWVLSTKELQYLLRNAQWSSAIVSVKQDKKWYHKQQLDFVVYTTDDGKFEFGYTNKITRTGKRFSPSLGRRYEHLLRAQLDSTNNLAATLHHKGMLVDMTFTRLLDSPNGDMWRLDWHHQHIAWDESVPKWAQESYPINEWASSELSLPELVDTAVPWEVYCERLREQKEQEAQGQGAQEQSAQEQAEQAHDSTLENALVREQMPLVGVEMEPLAATQPKPAPAKAPPPPPPPRPKAPAKAPPPPPPRTPSQIKGAYADKLRLAHVQEDVIEWVLHPAVTVADTESYLRQYFPTLMTS